MASMGEPPKPLRRISLCYDINDSHASALRLILTLKPEWERSSSTVEFLRFTDGITNTLLKAVNKIPGLTQSQIDDEAVLLRAYGKGTQVLIDRERETRSHSLLSSYGLAPPLFARFENGLLYKFIEGRVCSPADLRRPEVWRGVARRLAQWHSTLPISSISVLPSSTGQRLNGNAVPTSGDVIATNEEESITPTMATPNLWTVMHKWIRALPCHTEVEVKRQANLMAELRWLVRELGSRSGLGAGQFVFSHCDLLSGNVIILPDLGLSQSSSPSSQSSNASTASDSEDGPCAVSFIDYEYATPAPAAFDIANHFAEWGGFDCDFSVLPTRSQRRDFLRHYLSALNAHLHQSDDNIEQELDELSAEVDTFRGLPGFYWGIWALIQATISQIDFDYASYAEIRLGEYWDWKAETQGHEESGERQMSIRERRWAQEE